MAHYEYLPPADAIYAAAYHAAWVRNRCRPPTPDAVAAMAARIGADDALRAHALATPVIVADDAP